MTVNRQLIMAARTQFAKSFDRPADDVGIVDGVCWATARSPVVGINGYAMVPAEGHPWSAGLPEGLDELLSAHGGITCAWHPWVGFDTAHAGDYWDPQYDPKGFTQLYLSPGFGTKRWTPALVAAEARKLAIQVARIGFAARRAAARCETQQSRFRNLDIKGGI